MKNWLSKNWLQIVLVVTLIVIIVFVFQKKDSPDELNEYILRQKSDSILLIIKERDSLQSILDITEDSIANHLDSLLHVAVDNQNKTLNELQKQRNTIIVPDYGSDSLRSYFSRLLPVYRDLHTE